LLAERPEPLAVVVDELLLENVRGQRLRQQVVQDGFMQDDHAGTRQSRLINVAKAGSFLR
jgi:hypothetical protein